MVLTKDELISALQHEVRLLLHLASKVEPAMLDYQPTPGQRNLLELLQYLTIMGPIHLRGVLAPTYVEEEWVAQWNSEQAAAKTRNLEAVKVAIAKQSALFTELLGPCTDADLRASITLWGSTASRGSMIVSIVLCHYVAYRMQLFLYLKACGRPELNTMNLWVGVDGPMKA